MAGSTKTTRFRFWLWLIRIIGVIVPRRLRADWRQEWEAELRYRELLLADWDKLNWKTKFDLLRRSLGAFRDALLLQPRRLEDEMFQDVRYGLRMLRRNPGFTLVAVLSLAIGVGATTTVFSVANAVLLRPLPVKDAAELVSVHKPDSTGSGIHVVSYPDYLDYRDRNEVFSEMLVWSEASLSLNTHDQPEAAYAMVVSGNYFSLLGVQPAIGRFFSPEEDRAPGANPVTVISFGLWQKRFGGDASVPGQRIKLNGHPFTIIGVAPKDFTSTYNVFAPALYVPLMMQAQVLSKRDIFSARMSKYLKLTGRLRPGVSAEQAQAALSNIDRQLEEAYAQKGESTMRANHGLELVPVGSFPPEIRLEILGAAGLLMAIVGFVLLIACANVAGVLLARATSRQREIAVRFALGATRIRLIRQLLTESGLLFLLAAAAGVGLTIWLTRMISKITLPDSVPFALDVKVDWRVLSFTLVLSMFTGLVFGLAPAMAASKADLIPALKDAPSVLGVKRSRLRNAFVIGQIALSLVLLVGAGLFTRAIQYAQTVYPGNEPDTVLTADIDPREQGYTTAQSRAFYQRLIERLTAFPGVELASLAQELYIGEGYSTTNLVVKDVNDESKVLTEFNTVAPDYFRTMGIALLAGRDFTPADREGAPRVVIVDEATARRFWPGTSPLGKQVRVRGAREWAEVVGVVENSKHRISGQSPPPFVYEPYLQYQSDNSRMTVLVRHRGDTTNVVSAIRHEVQTLDPDLPLQSAMTLTEAVRLATLPLRIANLVATAFGLVGLALAALGIYGLVSYAVNQRTHELGVRVALGAQKRDIFKLVVGHGLKLALLGVIVGLALSLGLTRMLAALLFGVSTTDPVTYLSVSLLLVIVALGACLSPARKAIRTDPMVALRHE
ncbi:MAG: ABC transporter permease [Acidobacteriota bacterium]